MERRRRGLHGSPKEEGESAAACGVHGRNVYAACSALYGVRVPCLCVPICHKGGGREKERKLLASDFWRSLRERPEKSKAGERRLAL